MTTMSERIKTRRAELGLTQEGLAEAANRLLKHPVSLASVQKMERTGYRLPRRSRAGGGVLPSVVKALNLDVRELLMDCFSVEEIRESAFAYLLDSDVNGMPGPEVGLQEFADWLPVDCDSLLGLVGASELVNGRAFVYIFALEQHFDALEMLVVNEPPIIFLDSEDVSTWADGMRLTETDKEFFVETVFAYQRHFLELVRSGKKAYSVVVNRNTLKRFWDRKSAARRQVQFDLLRDTMAASKSSELFVFDSTKKIEEMEVVSAYREIPHNLDDTVSVVIRQNSMTSDYVQYHLIPMPRTLFSLQHDISIIGELRAATLDQYRELYGSEYGTDRKMLAQLTERRLREILEELA